jgi:hypothetical protein
MDDLRATRGLRALLAVTLAIVAGGLAGPSSASAQIAFGKSSLSGFSTARPTSLQFGPTSGSTSATRAGRSRRTP